ncbi:hypothetical protein PRK78_000176 [Emydomyces testavorans]|uniref:polynucleotide adenylyltransferase n=1 Tax=Emydomyces testavorans TaxID=2070801 RepID=A0AAF0DA70_9EURO|nr:hypothetical protein PRK78_000176 [Emydomyces testavorans]
MATSEQPSASRDLSLNFFQTSLCVVPPAHLCGEINRLRFTYDQTYGRWPPHINILHPFVAAASLPEAAALIGARLAALRETSSSPDVHIRLDGADYFSTQKGKIIHLAPRPSGGTALKHLRNIVLEALGQPESTLYNAHLTIGQTKANDEPAREALLSKAQLLSPIEWTVEELVVLVRERVGNRGSKTTKMRVWGTIDISGNFTMMKNDEDGGEAESSLYSFGTIPEELVSPEGLVVEPMTTYQFRPDGCIWRPCSFSSHEAELAPDNLTVSSYNVLLDHPHPPPRARYPALVRNILSKAALADVLLLQEVCDDFLSHLLAQDDIRNHYRFVSHGPPDQAGIGPLSLQRNIIALSRFKFSWEVLTFKERHKNAVVLEMKSVGRQNGNSEFSPLIIAAIHLSSGLTDKRVLAKESQFRTLFNFFEKNYPNNPCIIAGDTNIITSAITIEKALQEELLSPEGVDRCSQLETLLSKSRFQDAWLVARVDAKYIPPYLHDDMTLDDLHEGEQGATFDPQRNPLAAASAGFDGRPERYDRILVDGKGTLKVVSFNLFGLPNVDTSFPWRQTLEEEAAWIQIGSDHWGVKATFKIQPQSEEPDTTTEESTLFSLKSPANLADKHSLDECLHEYSMLPSNEDIDKRHGALGVLRNLVIRGPVNQAENIEQNINGPSISMVLVPVGSYGLGVWSPSSDIDCLFIGPISSKTFFAVAEQRLRKAADAGIRILRKVIATTGTMLELEVNGVKCDLQYCPAARVVAAWRNISQLPPDDPTFHLSSQALTKLQAFRDLDYIQRSLPDLASFRTAHRFITAWAKHRGIYLARFGYLGGIHITMMLSRICKLLCREGAKVSSTDLICTFFNHYAHFNWENEIVFDPCFFESPPRYRRYVNEPMVILTIHTPLVNVARAATASSKRVIVEELQRMAQFILVRGMSWLKLLGGSKSTSGPSQEFLMAYNSYIKIHVQYWGISLAKGSTLVGWLESRCVRLLNDIDRRLPGIYTRIWPARFTSKEATGDDTEYQGCYLIGLARKDIKDEAETATKEERKQNLALLQRILEQFKSQAQAERKYFDPATAWLDVTHVKQSELGSLKLDEREWGTYILADDLSDSEGDEEDENVDIKADEAAAVAAGQAARKVGSSKGVPSKPGVKLRPAADILSRLRWDPNIDSGNYVVGYEDRFLGSLEIPLDNWKTEQTDEEFIPQHRIIYFRRKSDGVVVWERESKKDLIFGSGVEGEAE